MHEMCGGKVAEITQKSRKLCGKYNFKIKISSIKFHFKVRKLRKALFKRGLDRKVRNKNDLEKYGRIIL